MVEISKSDWKLYREKVPECVGSFLGAGEADQAREEEPGSHY